MATQALPYVSPEEYLALDRAAEQRSEYVNGQIYAMAGGTRQHSRICVNTIADLSAATRGRCAVYSSDLRLFVEKTSAYFYPDVLATCSAGHAANDLEDTITDPQVLIEVTSKSSEAYDRGAKFHHYRNIPSLGDYLIIDQFRILVEHYSRQPDGAWLFREYASPELVIALPSIGAELNISGIYRDIEFTSEA
jgi:Uma2 family endonuclease